MEEKKKVKAKPGTKKDAADKLDAVNQGLALGYFLSSSGDFYYYDILNKSGKVHYISYKKAQGSDDLIVGPWYYLIGGVTAWKDIVAFPLPGLEHGYVKHKMNVGKIYSTSIGIASAYIMTVGGMSPEGVSMNCCERYDIAKDKWTLMKPLNVPQECATLGLFDDRYIYAFEGRSNWVFQSTIEVYDLLDPEGGWTLINPFKSDGDRDPRGGAFCAQNSNQTFIVAGGTVSFDNNGFDDIAHYRLMDKKFTVRPGKLQRGAEFYPVIPHYRHHFYQLSYSYRNPSYDLFVYSIVSDSFTMIEAKNIWTDSADKKKPKSKAPAKTQPSPKHHK